MCVYACATVQYAQLSKPVILHAHKALDRGVQVLILQAQMTCHRATGLVRNKCIHHICDRPIAKAHTVIHMVRVVLILIRSSEVNVTLKSKLQVLPSFLPFARDTSDIYVYLKHVVFA
jgi:hypothetical protein